MTPNFNSHNDQPQSAPAGSQNPAAASMPLPQRDRFELLSAYIDGEVTAAERRQVEAWLAEDPTMQRLHSQLLKLHHSFQSMPVPEPAQSVEKTVADVLARVDRKPHRRFLWGSAALAALFVGGLATVFSGERGFVPSIASNRAPETQIESPQTDAANSERLLIALDKPLVAIPKAPVADPNAPVDTNLPQRPETSTQ